MASVRVLYFAGLRDAVGREEESLEVAPAVQTVGDLCEVIAARHAAYAASRAQVRVARNEAFAGPAEPLEDGDVIALIPPVAGG